MGCGAATPDAISPDKTERRRPDGVAIDPTSAPPLPRERAQTSDRLVTLRTPLGAEVALSTLDDFFRRVLLKDDGIEVLFTKDAIALGGSINGGGGPEGNLKLSNWWRARFRKLDYTKLVGETLYQESEVEIYRAGDDADSPSNANIQLDALSEGDIVLRFPMLTTRYGADRYFGDEMIVWMRREADRYRIYRVLEEFQLN